MTDRACGPRRPWWPASWLIAGVALAAVAASLLSRESAPAAERSTLSPTAAAATPSPTTSDSALAVRLLAGARGTSPLACQMIVRSLALGYGWGGGSSQPDTDPNVEEVIRWAVSRREDPSAVPPLRGALLDSDRCVSRVAARLLGKTRHPQATRALRDALDSSEAGTRRLAAIGLGYGDDPSVVDPLLRALDDEDPGVRVAAAWALGEIEDERSVPRLVRLLERDGNAQVRRAAASALGEMLD